MRHISIHAAVYPRWYQGTNTMCVWIPFRSSLARVGAPPMLRSRTVARGPASWSVRTTVWLAFHRRAGRTQTGVTWTTSVPA